MRSIDDYYHALGLDPGCSEEEVRRAYKALVLKFHPDRGEGSDPARFREIQEAYEILTDPEKCSELRRRDARGAPLRRNNRRGVQADVAEDWLTEDQTEELAKDLFGWRSPRFRATGGSIEIILTPEEARRGGKIPLRVPVSYPCGQCGGSGGEFFFICPACAGTGARQFAREITLDIRPNSIGSGGQEFILEGNLRVSLRLAE